ncbi:uncharacterized protein [Patagioenas fasciata]|uniref:uncharacterized protein n=1 Tax=Patagioenas fasciata TaxID=372321 RepID=UPI003A9A383F
MPTSSKRRAVPIAKIRVLRPEEPAKPSTIASTLGTGRLHSAALTGGPPQLGQEPADAPLCPALPACSPHHSLEPCLVRVNCPYLISRTPLHLACANGHADVVRFMAGKKCKLNPHGMYKKTPLMLAVQHQHKDCVTALLEHGADADHKGAGGNTALHMAALMPSKAMVELLLEHNAQIDARNDLGYTPLAVAIIERREEMVEFLLQNGADVNAQDSQQR